VVAESAASGDGGGAGIGEKEEVKTQRSEVMK
jgi:hypothetical protein